MRVFISSVRRGLEAERDSLPGLILALGHDPKRFEDFGAQAIPSREACLRGVAESDVYLLLLGPHYGHVFPETGQSATHDEWIAAITKGMPRLVFRKKGVGLEAGQEEFARLVGDYGHGAFYAEFTDVAELQTQVVQALRGLESQLSSLTFAPLGEPVGVRWRQVGHQGSVGTSPWLELNVVPLNAEQRSARQIRELPALLVSSLRSAGALPPASGAETLVEDGSAVVALPAPQNRRWSEPSDGALAGVSVASSGQVSLWWTLPSDGLGSILDPDKLIAAVASGLRLVGALNVLPDGDAAIGIGLGGNTMMMSEGRVTGVARTSATMSHSGDQPVRVPPDEAVSTAAFDRGAEEVARSLVQALLDAFRVRR